MLRAAALVLALVAAGCGGSGERSPEDVVRAWSSAINAGDNEAAAELFADGAQVVQGSVVLRLESHEEAVAWNESLPCSGTIVSLRAEGDAVRATFLLDDRKRSRCDGPGERVGAVFRVRDGKIVLWHQTGGDGNRIDPSAVV